MDTNKILPLIPARGGSKGIVNKNIYKINNKPLIQYTIETSINSGMFDEIYVSTDSKKIADTSLQLGAAVPFLRPDNLAQDKSASIDVIIHALEWFKSNQDRNFDYVLLLQPTSPLRSPEDIINSINLMRESMNASAVVSVTKISEPHPDKVLKINKDNHLESYITKYKKPFEGRRQDLTKVYARNGAIYLVKAEDLLAKNSIYCGITIPYKMPFERSVNIDTYSDITIMEAILGNGKQKK